MCSDRVKLQLTGISLKIRNTPSAAAPEPMQSVSKASTDVSLMMVMNNNDNDGKVLFSYFSAPHKL